MSRLLAFTAGLALAAAEITSSSLESYVDVMTLTSSFNPIKPAYWTGYPHHRRTPFALSPDGSRAYLAYLDSNGTGVHVQSLDPTTFKATGNVVTVADGQEAGGLVAHNDGFALLTNEVISGEGDGEAIPVLYRYTDGVQTFRTLLGGPGIDEDDEMASPDINGDLVFSEEAGYYGAYIVVTSYNGSAAGHYGDAIRYVNTNGTLENIAGASSSWGCSHNTGIAFEAADAPPYASLCAEDQGEIWLNTKTQGMTTDGVKVSNEHVIDGDTNEAMGGMSGSYSGLARFQNEDSYIFTWVSRGAINLTENAWMGDGYTTAVNRTSSRHVAMAIFTDKYTLNGTEAISTVGAADGDSQVNWITEQSTPNDCSNAHVATFDETNALITWEEISDPICDYDAMGCRGTFAGTKFQLVNSAGSKLGDVLNSDDVYVAGDMVTMTDGRICWPYVSMTWKLDNVETAADVQTMSFACMTNGDSSSSSSSDSTSSVAAAAVSTSAAVSASAAVLKSAAATAAAVETSVAAAAVAESSAAVESSAATAAAVDTQSAKGAVTKSAKAAASSAAQAAADAETSATPVAVQTSDASLPTDTPAAGGDDCEEETSAAGAAQTAAAQTSTSTRKGHHAKTGSTVPTSVLGSGSSEKTCGGHTVTQTVYVTASA